MQSRERYVVVGIIVLGVLAGVALSHTLVWLWGTLELDDMPVAGIRQLPLTSLIAYVGGLAGITFCLKHAPTRMVANEVVEELSKVTWPTREETGSATVVVIVTVLICSAYLGVFDAFWLWVTDWLLGAKQSLAS